MCKLPFFQIEEINFREDDISADMIPVPQKKGRGRPRKYLRLEDVLEWRLQKEKGGGGDPGSNPGPGEATTAAAALQTVPEVKPSKRKLDISLKEETKTQKHVKNVTSNSLGLAPGMAELQQEQLEQPAVQEQLLPDQQGQAVGVNEVLTDLNDDKLESLMLDEKLNNKVDTFNTFSNCNSSSFDNNSSSHSSSHSSSCDNNSYDFNIDDEADEVDFPGF